MTDIGIIFLILTIFNFIVAICYRLRYESEIKKKTITSGQLDRLVALEQVYTFFGVVCLAATLVLYNMAHL